MANLWCPLLLLIKLLLVATSTSAQDDEVFGPNINIEYKPDDCERLANAGDFVVIDYVAYVPGEGGSDHYDDSVNKGPIYFKLHDAASVAMPGWHIGVDGMCVGEKRDVLIPAGDMTSGHALPNTKVPPEGKDIGYHFTLKEIRDSPPVQNLFKQMDFNDNQEISKEEVKQYVDSVGLGGLERYPSQDKAIDAVFKQMDKDQDGVISHEEFPGPKHDEF